CSRQLLCPQSRSESRMTSSSRRLMSTLPSTAARHLPGCRTGSRYLASQHGSFILSMETFALVLASAPPPTSRRAWRSWRW
ncbi:unnamed protein product, partial [Prorocentrum cordatum]